jgi:hypothetical protein
VILKSMSEGIAEINGIVPRLREKRRLGKWKRHDTRDMLRGLRQLRCGRGGSRHG